jgi:hypothetical protein
MTQEVIDSYQRLCYDNNMKQFSDFFNITEKTKFIIPKYFSPRNSVASEFLNEVFAKFKENSIKVVFDEDENEFYIMKGTTDV